MVAEMFVQVVNPEEVKMEETEESVVVQEPVVSVVASVEPASVSGTRSLSERAVMHMAALRKDVQLVTGSTQIMTKFDASRSMFQAWVGPRFEQAELRGEWRTEAGAMRRLRNAKNKQAFEVSSALPRPIPGGGSVNALDDMDRRRRAASLEKPFNKWSRRVSTLAITLLVLTCAWIILRDALHRDPPAQPRYTAPATSERVTTPPEPEEDRSPPPTDQEVRNIRPRRR